MKRDKKRKDGDKRVDTASPGKLTSNPFAGLSGLRDRLPAGEEAPANETEASGPETSAAAPEEHGAGGPARAVVRYQRKGRGGKEVTLVEGLGLPADDLDRWLGELKRGLGCGGAREGEALVLQGDQRERLPALLEARGVRRVSVS